MISWSSLVALAFLPLLALAKSPAPQTIKIDQCGMVTGSRRTCVGPQGAVQCQRECSQDIGTRLAKSSCEEIVSWMSKLCICFTDCVIGAIFGDPHIVTFDGLPFSYHGTCRHLAMQTVGNRELYPDFSIFMKNVPFKNEIDDVTLPGEVNIRIDKWKLDLAFNEGADFKIDGKAHSLLPFFFQTQENGRHYILKIDSKVQTITKNGHTSLVKSFTLVSNFGLNAVYEESDRQKNSRGNGFYVMIPKLPMFFGHTRGILGLYDKNQTNDGMTANGTLVNLKSPLGPYNLGDSYCVAKSEITPKELQLKHIQAHTHRMTACKNDPTKSATMTELCQSLKDIRFIRCVGQNAANEALEECFSDTCYSHGYDNEKSSACNVISVYATRCGLPINC